MCTIGYPACVVLVQSFVSLSDSKQLMSAPATMSNLPVEAPDKEADIQRNPHGNWEAVQASRPDFDSSLVWAVSKTPVPEWKAGQGATSEKWKKRRRISIAPYEDGRSTVQNYKLMISTTVPRPIALVTTVRLDGVGNMAPFSYFQNVCADVSDLRLVVKQRTSTHNHS
jgi:hypothetical protein